LAKNLNNHNPEEQESKIISLDGSNYLLVEYPDFIEDSKNNRIRVKGIGEKFASVNSFFLDYLKEYHIPVAFIKNESKNSLKFLKYQKFPFYVKIFNAADKRTAKIFNIKECEPLNLPVFEFHFGNGKDSIISESHLISFDLCTYEELKLINRICSKVNAVLKSYFERRGVLLAELDCCFGKADEKIYIIEDFTPKSIKVIPNQPDNKFVDPYKISTPAQLKRYTEQIFNMSSS
jgi:phosphoribosylaminoimidazole-succinocarboxamide synthase